MRYSARVGKIYQVAAVRGPLDYQGRCRAARSSQPAGEPSLSTNTGRSTDTGMPQGCSRIEYQMHVARRILAVDRAPPETAEPALLPRSIAAPPQRPYDARPGPR